MAVHSRHVAGKLAFYDTHRMRLTDVVGEGVTKYVLEGSDFQQAAGTGTDGRGYVTTVVEAGAGTSEAEASDEAGIEVEMINAANENDGQNIQQVGERFDFASTVQLYYGIKLECDEATQSDLLVGLCITDTTLLAGMTDGVYFEKLDAATTFSTVTESGSSETQTDSLGTFADDTAVLLEFYYDGTTVYFFIDGVNVAEHTATIPTENLTPSFHFLNGEAVAHRLKVHWCKAFRIA